MTAIDWTFSLPFRGSNPIQQPAVHMTFGILMLGLPSISIPPVFGAILLSRRGSFRVITTVLLSVPNISISFLLIAFSVQVKAGCKLGDQSFPSVQSKAVNHFSTKTLFPENDHGLLRDQSLFKLEGGLEEKTGGLGRSKGGFWEGGG